MSRRSSSRVSKPIQRFSPERELVPAMQQGSGRKRQIQSENFEIPLEARGTMQLMETLLRVTSSGEISCLQCGSQISPTHERLLEHAIVVHENIGLFCCSVCDFGANSSMRILQHVRMEHLPEEKSVFTTVYDKYGIEFVNLTLANCYGKAVWIDDEAAVMPARRQSGKSLHSQEAEKRRVEVVHRPYATAKVEQAGSSVGFAAPDNRRRTTRRSNKLARDEESEQIYDYDAIDEHEDDVNDEDFETAPMKRQRRGGSKRLAKQIIVSPMIESELHEPGSEFSADTATMNAPNSKNFLEQHKLCQKCLKQIRVSDLFIHALSFHQKIPLFYCPICEHSSDKMDDMLVHIHASHRDSDSAEPEGVRKILGDEFVDNVMRQCYGDAEEEVLSSAMHLREQGARYRRFICAQCFIQIPCKAEVMYHHLMKHATTLPYRCSLCYFGSKCEEQVQEHLIVRHLDADALSKKVLISAEVQATVQNLIDMASACFPQIFDAESIGGAERSKPRSAYHGIANALITEIRKQLGNRENSATGERNDSSMTSTGDEIDAANFSAGSSIERHQMPRRPPRRNHNVVTASSIADATKMHPAVLEVKIVYTLVEREGAV